MRFGRVNGTGGSPVELEVDDVAVSVILELPLKSSTLL